MQVETIPVEQAVGRTLCHDVTSIIPGRFKGPLLRKGHVIQAGDLEALLQAGKQHVYVLQLAEDDVHEDAAGLRIARAAAGSGVRLAGPKEGRVNLIAEQAGLLQVHLERLEQLNALPDIVFATLPRHRMVAAGEVVAGTKVVPLVVSAELLQRAENVLQVGPIVQVAPWQAKSVGLVITGDEVHSGRVTDAFAPLLSTKLVGFGSSVCSVAFAPDNAERIAALIRQQLAAGAELILVTGGMSVDPDDVTPCAVRLAGAAVEQYGAPVLPGAMFLLAYHGEVPVLGVPACGIFFRTTVLDLVLPRLLAGERLSRPDIIGLAHGGLCRGCDPCHYPACSFGVGNRC